MIKRREEKISCNRKNCYQKGPILIYTKVRIESCRCTWKVSGYPLQQMLKHLRRVFLDSKRHYDGFVGTFITQKKRAKNYIRLHEAGEYGGAFWTKMQSNRYLHSIGSYFHSTGSYLSSIRSYFHSIGSYLSSIRSYFHPIGSYLSSIRSYFNYFVASYITLIYSSVTFHIYPYLRGNRIPSDRNYRSAVVIIWSAVKRGRLNLDLVFVWRHTTYDYITCN